ncbi:hypothetical protein EJ08DRAFT_21168 [Tothia fuscella]|uniref:MYND-type zinc finger protein samB n=1 Tax=Tothia fuscella TaxID=1048955 RepID=A0A9P4U2J6_9PEZI|nr:hypothetical protein EJ08DRAFT_21168 [Tothia fuscella]
MREVNFSIPNANKASVGITTALYDRRALDCTSTLPLINSLNNLAYLTTSSARIRDILTVDGGVERLVCILKEGRSTKDMMECWKWNLAFQCVVNIGVRGSENVRTRVVEADMVPVIATILDNYVKVIEKCREKADAEFKRSTRLGPSAKHFAQRANELFLSGHGLERIRRQAPPPIDTSSPMRDSPQEQPPLPAFSMSSPPERTTFARTHHVNRSTDSRTNLFNGSVTPRAVITQPLVTSVPTMEGMQDTFGLRPVRDADRLPSMLSSLPAAALSRPDSPTTPSASANLESDRHLLMRRRGPERRPSIRHQLSMSGDSDEGPSDDAEPNGSGGGPSDEPVVGLEDEMNMQDIVESEAIIEAGGSPVRLDPQASDPPDVDAFSLARSAIESSMLTPTNQAATNINISPIQHLNTITTTPPPIQVNPYARYVQERSATSGTLLSMPRDEDVLMCLQLLAYVSKYCNLRAYFQRSHLVPKLKIPGAELHMLNEDCSQHKHACAEEEVEEYLQPDDFNIFPLVEKFTVRHHTQDMQYWAGVVMRNLCRKDDARGGIRQCAYYQCGKWEEWTRQFAKCRRCRRTKYCSKECQKSAWVYHRHWCVAATQ